MLKRCLSLLVFCAASACAADAPQVHNAPDGSYSFTLPPGFRALTAEELRTLEERLAVRSGAGPRQPGRRLPAFFNGPPTIPGVTPSIDVEKARRFRWRSP